ncbi:AbrB/MazE/SpoVT family DNA-binding domain-containing protein [Pseudoxanthomonas indica]|uniref:Putative addiction module antidote n=1 Tax=Pseudoxanthomonas indica TaxID=428993 RepID=A0A1T5LCA5_9GAMM|nr:AbrB/MazE/SpoVT family DNA-binding domain-containing protein [Pseudoxanthomonas indica]GGD33409.1 transcriptional regulator [Pseudoxanthomonas indica]SKC73632.1 putative addiction module antidote [Pseudoxanthomonas indica]
MKSLKLNRIGNSVGLVLPKDILARMRVAEGDTLYLTESPDGYRLTPFDPEFAEQMEAAEAVMRRRRDALRELAK